MEAIINETARLTLAALGIIAADDAIDVNTPSKYQFTLLFCIMVRPYNEPTAIPTMREAFDFLFKWPNIPPAAATNVIITYYSLLSRRV